jgi:hypothetical protein
VVPKKTRSDSDVKLPARKAGLLQVAKTLFFGLLMVGKKSTWEKDGDGARMTPGQIVVGAVIGGILLVAALVALVRTVLWFATGS